MSYEAQLELGKEGGNILFCGAGFSAECLNFFGEQLGVGGPLLSVLNQKLGYPYSNLQSAADAYLEQYAEFEMMSFLKDRYAIRDSSLAARRILNYNWDRIYTTNYDNLISSTLSDLNVSHDRINNTEKIFDYKMHRAGRKWVVHLHGCAESWDIHNFSQSCVLGRESYFNISRGSEWTERLREDYAAAKNVFFLGFSNSDFYLARELYDSLGSKDKVYFLNRPEDVANRELEGSQKKFGKPLFIGIEEFGMAVEKAVSSDSRPPPYLACFEEFSLPDLPKNRAGVLEQENFLIKGVESLPLHYKDVFEGSVSYRAKRKIVDDITSFCQVSGHVSLVVGGICSGKSTILNEVALNLTQNGIQVFSLSAKYASLVTEAKTIIDAYPEAVIIIDDCFTLRNELTEIIKLANSSGTVLLLASRTLARDAVEDIAVHIKDSESALREFDTEILNADEVNNLISCADRIGGFAGQAISATQKQRILRQDGNSRLSGFLLYLFNSPHIKTRFVADYEKLVEKSPKAEEVIILALYLRHIGEMPQKNLISEMIGRDCMAPLLSAKGTFIQNSYLSENRGGSTFGVVASVNSREALKSIVTDQEKITDVIIAALKNLEQLRYDGIFKSAYSQMMRYTNLKGVISDLNIQNQFFDRLSELSFCRKHYLFWLQWSIAMREQKKYLKAQQYLDEAFARGRAIGPDWMSHQLNDQQAGLHLESVTPRTGSGGCLEKFNQACLLIEPRLKLQEQSAHPYTTLRYMQVFFDKSWSAIHSSQYRIYKAKLTTLLAIVEKNISNQYDGYVKICMEDAQRNLKKCIERLS